MPDPYGSVRRRADVTPQTEPIPGKPMVANSAGGYSFAVDKWGRLQRFLVLGTVGGTYYIGEKDLTAENVGVILDCLAEDYRSTIDIITAISEQGRAIKVQPPLFALAVAAGYSAGTADFNVDVRCYALSKLPNVARTASHLFTFTKYVQNFRGWGRSLRTAIGDWYQVQPPMDEAGEETGDEAVDAVETVDDLNEETGVPPVKTLQMLAYQVVKYRNRDGWTHQDLFRKAHPASADPTIGRFVLKGAADRNAPAVLRGFNLLQEATNAKQAAKILVKYRLPWETVPTQFLGEAAIWRTLVLEGLLPMTAMIRNLGRMTANGALAPGSDVQKAITAKLGQEDQIRAARVHPMTVLAALTTYTAGHSARGKGEWKPLSPISDALDSAFYTAFGNVEPTNKATLLALDISASMTWEDMAGVPGMTPRVGSAAMALITMAVEPNAAVVGFSAVPSRGPLGVEHGIAPLDISPKRRLDDVQRYINGLRAGGTDCSLPMQWAMQNSFVIETFVIYTDNETYAGNPHPAQALRQYRDASGVPARLVVVGMTSNGFTIADPDDAGQLDVVGFDTAVPQLISDFSAGNV